MTTRFVMATIALSALLGCAASTSQQRLELTPRSPPLPPTSQPAGESSGIDVQQLSGQIVAGMKAEFRNQIETSIQTTLAAQVNATGIGHDVLGYHSEFGVGATLVVTLTLILATVLSHRREMLRIKQNGRHLMPPQNGAIPNGAVQT